MPRGHSVRAAAVAACCWLLPTVAALAQPATGTVSPFNGSGAPGIPQQITITASDPGGWPNISHLDVLINSTGSGTNGCFFVYFPNLNSIYLWNDGVTTWAPGYADVAHQTGSTSNSHCTIYGSGSSISFLRREARLEQPSTSRSRLHAERSSSSGINIVIAAAGRHRSGPASTDGRWEGGFLGQGRRTHRT